MMSKSLVTFVLILLASSVLLGSTAVLPDGQYSHSQADVPLDASGAEQETVTDTAPVLLASSTNCEARRFDFVLVVQQTQYMFHQNNLGITVNPLAQHGAPPVQLQQAQRDSAKILLDAVEATLAHINWFAENFLLCPGDQVRVAVIGVHWGIHSYPDPGPWWVIERSADGGISGLKSMNELRQDLESEVLCGSSGFACPPPPPDPAGKDAMRIDFEEVMREVNALTGSDGVPSDGQWHGAVLFLTNGMPCLEGACEYRETEAQEKNLTAAASLRDPDFGYYAIRLNNFDDGTFHSDWENFTRSLNEQPAQIEILAPEEWRPRILDLTSGWLAWMIDGRAKELTVKTDPDNSSRIYVDVPALTAEMTIGAAYDHQSWTQQAFLYGSTAPNPLRLTRPDGSIYRNSDNFSATVEYPSPGRWTVEPSLRTNVRIYALSSPTQSQVSISNAPVSISVETCQHQLQSIEARFDPAPPTDVVAQWRVIARSRDGVDPQIELLLVWQGPSNPGVFRGSLPLADVGFIPLEIVLFVPGADGKSVQQIDYNIHRSVWQFDDPISCYPKGQRPDSFRPSHIIRGIPLTFQVHQMCDNAAQNIDQFPNLSVKRLLDPALPSSQAFSLRVSPANAFSWRFDDPRGSIDGAPWFSESPLGSTYPVQIEFLFHFEGEPQEAVEEFICDYQVHPVAVEIPDPNVNLSNVSTTTTNDGTVTPFYLSVVDAESFQDDAASVLDFYLSGENDNGGVQVEWELNRQNCVAENCRVECGDRFNSSIVRTNDGRWGGTLDFSECDLSPFMTPGNSFVTLDATYSITVPGEGGKVEGSRVLIGEGAIPVQVALSDPNSQ